MRALVLDRNVGTGTKSGKPFGVLKLIEQKMNSDFWNFGEFFCDPGLIKDIAGPGFYDVELGLGDFGDKPTVRSVKYLGPVQILEKGTKL